MSKGQFRNSQDFDTALMMDNIEGVTNASSFALSEGLAANAPFVLGTASATPVFPDDGGEVIRITNADAGNDGALIRVDALDAAFQPVQFDVPISGVGDFLVGDVPLTRVNGARNIADRGNELVADVTLHRPAPNQAEVVATVTAESQESQQAIYTVPAGVKWSVTSLTASMRKSGGTDTDVNLTLVAAEVGKVFRKVFGFGLQRSGDTTLEFINRGVQGAEGPTDLYLLAESSAAGTDVSARLTVRTAKG